jgi:hypothetical protein
MHNRHAHPTFLFRIASIVIITLMVLGTTTLTYAGQDNILSQLMSLIFGTTTQSTSASSPANSDSTGINSGDPAPPPPPPPPNW